MQRIWLKIHVQMQFWFTSALVQQIFKNAAKFAAAAADAAFWRLMLHSSLSLYEEREKNFKKVGHKTDFSTVIFMLSIGQREPKTPNFCHSGTVYRVTEVGPGLAGRRATMAFSPTARWLCPTTPLLRRSNILHRGVAWTPREPP